MQWMFRSLGCLTLASIVFGCASMQQPPGTVVTVSDVKSLNGTWVGTLINSMNMGMPANMVINSDGTYRAQFGAVNSAGTIALQPNGQLAFTMTSATTFLGTSEASSTATLYDRGGKRVLVGNGRVGFRQDPFSWEVTEQK
jgi:hypothetical protein